MAWTMMLATVAAAPATPPTSAQAQFDAAAAAFEKGDFATALAGYAALETRLAGAKSRTTLGIVRTRRGITLSQLGRSDEAAAAIRAGLADLPTKADPTGDRTDGLLTLGAIEETALDYAAAARDYDAALQLAPTQGSSRFSALAGIARTTMFDDPGRARAAANQTAALLTKDSGKPLVAQVRTLKGRVLLNAGDARGALAELRQATDDLGGLTYKVDRMDIEARSDVAIAALLSGDAETARKYLAYTGAGHTDAALPRVADLSLPPCGDPDGLRPDDVAVVQFAIQDNGAVTRVRPIYASRTGPVAIAFAKAVSTWSWTPAEVTKIKPFFRAATRLQLRCTSAQRQPPVLALLDAAILQWLSGRGIADAPGAEADSAVRGLAADRAAIAKADPGGDTLAVVPPLLSAAGNPIMPADERPALLERAEAMLTKNGAPDGVLAAIRAKRLLAEGERRSTSSIFSRQVMQARLRAVAADPVVAADPRVGAVIRLTLADILALGGAGDERGALLASVAGDVRFQPSDPLRVGALVRQAAFFAQRRDLAAARASFGQTGLSAQQCALVDARPAMVRDGSSPSDFPMDAMRWGFEGWSRQEFDVTADGRPANVRTIVAYPPFVFEKAGQSVVAKLRYQQSYRPAGGLGCSASTQTVAFGLP